MNLKKSIKNVFLFITASAIISGFLFINALYAQSSTENQNIVVRIDNRTMSMSNLNSKLSKLEENLKKQKGFSDLKGLANENYQKAIKQYRKEIIKDWVDITLLALESEKQGLTVSDAELNANINKLKSDSTQKFDIDSYLLKIGLNKEEFLSEMRDGLLGAKLINKILYERYNEKALEDFYEKYKLSFINPAEVKVERIIKIRYRRESDRAKKEAIVSMKKVLKIAKKGNPFDQIVLNYNTGITDDSDKLQYVVMKISESDRLQGIYDEAFKLKPGEVSNIIDTKSSLNIIKLISKRPASGANYKDAKEHVKTFLSGKIRDEMVKSLRGKYQIKLYMQLE